MPRVGAHGVDALGEDAFDQADAFREVVAPRGASPPDDRACRIDETERRLGSPAVDSQEHRAPPSASTSAPCRVVVNDLAGGQVSAATDHRPASQ